MKPPAESQNGGASKREVGAGEKAEHQEVQRIATDISRFTLPQDFSDAFGTLSSPPAIAVRNKPKRQEFFRIHPEPSYQWQVLLLIDELEDETYVIDQAAWAELDQDGRAKAVFLGVNTVGAPFLWAINLPEIDGRNDSWSRSKLHIARIAMTTWVRARSNRDVGVYEPVEAPNLNLEPQWPAASPQEVFERAFRDRIIDGPNHPVVRRLKGKQP